MSREVTVRADTDGAHLVIVAEPIVPWNVVIVVGGRRESMARGALEWRPGHVVPLDVEHGTLPSHPPSRPELAMPVGRLIEHDDRTDGLHGVFRMADTDTARNAWALTRDGIYNGTSPTFFPLEGRDIDHTRPQDGQGHILRAVLTAVGLTSSAAYPGTVANAEARAASVAFRQRRLLQSLRQRQQTTRTDT